MISPRIAAVSACRGDVRPAPAAASTQVGAAEVVNPVPRPRRAPPGARPARRPRRPGRAAGGVPTAPAPDARRPAVVRCTRTTRRSARSRSRRTAPVVSSASRTGGEGGGAQPQPPGQLPVRRRAVLAVVRRRTGRVAAAPPAPPAPTRSSAPRTAMAVGVSPWAAAIRRRCRPTAAPTCSRSTSRGGSAGRRGIRPGQAATARGDLDGPAVSALGDRRDRRTGAHRPPRRAPTPAIDPESTPSLRLSPATVAPPLHRPPRARAGAASQGSRARRRPYGVDGFAAVASRTAPRVDGPAPRLRA